MNAATSAAVLASLAAAFVVAGLWEVFSRSASEGESDHSVRAWLTGTLDLLGRAHREGYLPTSDERFRLAGLLTLVSVVAGWWFIGPVVAIALAVAAPMATGWLISRGRSRYRRGVEKALPEVARAIADCLTAGHSPRGALVAATRSLDGPALAEFRQLAFELETGSPTSDAIRNLARRFGSARIDAFASALISQRLAGGDLAALMRRFAEGAAERDRVAEDARAATAQARFTGYLVVAMPAGAALFTELLRPGFLSSILGSVPAMILVGLSLLLQAFGFLLISRLARIGAG
jgi:tight adherence protein B